MCMHVCKRKRAIDDVTEREEKKDERKMKRRLKRKKERKKEIKENERQGLSVSK